MTCCNNKNDGILDSIFIKCDCSTCAVELARVEETYDKSPPYKVFELSVWHLTGGRPLCWKERIRWVWRILRTGMPWSDMVVLSDDKAKKLSKFITKHTS